MMRYTFAYRWIHIKATELGPFWNLKPSDTIFMNSVIQTMWWIIFWKTLLVSLCILLLAKCDIKFYPLWLRVKLLLCAEWQHSIKQHFSWSTPTIVTVFKGNNGGTDLYCVSYYQWRWSVCRDYWWCTALPKGHQSSCQLHKRGPERSERSSSQTPVAVFGIHSLLWKKK